MRQELTGVEMLFSLHRGSDFRTLVCGCVLQLGIPVYSGNFS